VYVYCSKRLSLFADIVFMKRTLEKIIDSDSDEEDNRKLENQKCFGSETQTAPFFETRENIDNPMDKTIPGKHVANRCLLNIACAKTESRGIHIDENIINERTTMLAQKKIELTELFGSDSDEQEDALGYCLRPNTPSCWISQPNSCNDALSFALSNLPSTWKWQGVAWIHAHAPLHMTHIHRDNSVAGYCGKWMWFVTETSLDDVFIKVVDSLQKGLLGHSVKVPPPDSDSTVHPIIVYTKDFRDQADVLRVGLELRKLGGNARTLSYKPDVFTMSNSGIHGSGELEYKTIFQLKPQSNELTLVGKNGAALAVACEMVEREEVVSGQRMN
jgi:hypothetical protein